MSSQQPGSTTWQEGERQDPRQLLGRLTSIGLTERGAVDLILSFPNQHIARAVDALEALGPAEIANPRDWLLDALDDPQRVEAVLERRRGWDAWHRMHRSWEAADSDRAEQERRSRGWGVAVSRALDDQQLQHAVEAVTEPLGVLGRRSLPVARAQLLAWAVSVHRAQPDLPLSAALRADLTNGRTQPDHLEAGLPEPPVSDGGRDDLNERLAAAIGRLTEIESDLSSERAPAAAPSIPQPEPSLERSLGREW